MKLIPSLLAGALALGMTGAAVAGTATTSLPVTATITQACAITATNMQFADLTSLSADSGFTGATSQTNIALTCNDANMNAVIELDAQPMVNLASPADPAITYNLFQDAARTLPWGTEADGTAMTLASVYGKTDLNVFALIPIQDNVVAGAYSAPINVTVTY